MQTSASCPSLRAQLRAASDPTSPHSLANAHLLSTAKPGSAGSNMPRPIAPSMPRPASTGSIVTKATLSQTSPQPLQAKFHQLQYFHKPFDTAYEEVAKRRNLMKLENLFEEADADGSGEMSLEEFREALRIPRIQRAFSVLGVQPHQSDLIFQALDKDRSGEISISNFMRGLTQLVGTDADGTGCELDVETLRPGYKSRVKYHSHFQARQSVNLLPHAKKVARNKTSKPRGAFDLGPTHALPADKVRRAFVQSASALALHAATSRR